MADRMERLNALASGGTAGLAAFDQAQQSVAANNRTAIDSALGYGGQSAPTGAMDAAKALVGRYTAGYTADAASARSNAGDQVGYDKSALDAFLANQQKKLDAQRSQALQNEELSQQQLQAELASQGRKTDYYLRKAAEGGGSALSGLSLTEQDNKVTGRALSAQQQAMAEQAAKQKAAEDAIRYNQGGQGETGAITSAKIAARHAAENPDKARQENLQGPYVDAQAMYNDRAKQAEATAQKAEADRAAAIQQAALDRLALAKFQQEAAVGLGMDPDIAAGRYPLDELSLLKRQGELDKVDNYELDRALAQQDNLDKETKLALEQSGISYSKVKGAATSTGISPQAAANLAASDKFAEVQQAAMARYGQGGAAETQFTDFADDIDSREDLSAQEKAFYKQYFRSLFYTSPTTGQYDNAQYGADYGQVPAGSG